VTDSKSTRNCNAVLFVASSGVGEEISWPKGAVDGVEGVPRILFLVGPTTNLATVSAASEAVGEDNVDNPSCVVSVADPTEVDLIEESLYDSVKSLMAYRAGGGDDPKLIRVTKDEVVRRVIRQVIWWKGAEVEGRDILRAVTRAVRKAGNLLNNEVKKDGEKKKNFPAEEFCANGSVPSYFGRGHGGGSGVLPKKWTDRNKKGMSTWANMPLLINSGRESDEKRILIDMLMGAMRGDEGEKGVVLSNIQDLCSRNLWRRALEELCGFWERIVIPRAHDPGYLYLDHGALGRVMKGLLSVVNQQGSKKGRSKKKALLEGSENDWEQKEWAEEREREEKEEAEWLDGEEDEEDDGTAVYALVDEEAEEEEEAEELFSPPPAPLSDRSSNKRRLGGWEDTRGGEMEEADDIADFKKAKKTILSEHISNELSESAAFSARLRAMVNADVGI